MKGTHMKESKVWPRISLALNVLMALAIAAACVWKFTDVRYLVEDVRGGVFV